MASYAELRALAASADGDELRKRIEVAIAVKAQELIDLASPTANQLTWAAEALDNPGAKADQIMNYVLAANKSATTAQITGAADTAIQTNVDAAVDKLVA